LQDSNPRPTGSARLVHFPRRKKWTFAAKRASLAPCRERGRFWLLRDPAPLAIAPLRGLGGDGAECRYDLARVGENLDLKSAHFSGPLLADRIGGSLVDCSFGEKPWPHLVLLRQPSATLASGSREQGILLLPRGARGLAGMRASTMSRPRRHECHASAHAKKKARPARRNGARLQSQPACQAGHEDHVRWFRERRCCRHVSLKERACGNPPGVRTRKALSRREDGFCRKAESSGKTRMLDGNAAILHRQKQNGKLFWQAAR
jgi:hypothetical protein